jgi:hypothetical protein
LIALAVLRSGTAGARNGAQADDSFGLGGSRFTCCRCHGSEFHHATVIDTDFIKRLFYGAALDLSPSA